MIKMLFDEGKRLTILCSTLIVICILGILTTNSTALAALYGATVLGFTIITWKSAYGWSIRRAAQKRWEKEAESVKNLEIL